MSYLGNLQETAEWVVAYQRETTPRRQVRVFERAVAEQGALLAEFERLGISGPRSESHECKRDCVQMIRVALGQARHDLVALEARESEEAAQAQRVEEALRAATRARLADRKVAP